MDKENFMLPEAFMESMKELLSDEYDEFIKSYRNERFAGLRYNPLKADKDTFLKAVPFGLTPVEWAFEGFYYDLSETPGKHPLHEAGAYYIQEPSAMSAVSLLDPVPGDIVLDMCAAPGGKSTQIAGRLMGKGLLVSNEIIKDRAKILSSNIERMGVENAVVLNESPASLSKRFSSFFDKILVDAPCSGEGMFKKEENALSEWSPENVRMCHERQLSILDEAAPMLKAGGTLCFSTCTFNSLENEGTVEAFCKAHPEFTLVTTKRIWPHKSKGEGHFVAKFVKEGTLTETVLKRDAKTGKKNDITRDVIRFLTDEIHVSKACIDSLSESCHVEVFGENIYFLPSAIGSLSGLKVERPGLHVAVLKKNRFEPSHSLALFLRPCDIDSYYELSDEEAVKYLRGETINCDPLLKGWILMTVKGFSVGFGKASQGIIKNHYPKGLRR